MTTKERIIDQALDLFSRKGYDGVSVRDISGAVGIKESSLYNHFKNKQDIFDTIVEEGFLRAGNYFRQQCRFPAGMICPYTGKRMSAD